MTQMPPPPGSPPGGYPPGSYVGYQPVPPQGGNAGLAIASLVLGILSIPCFCLSWIDFPVAIVAIILGVIALNKAKSGQAGGRGMALAGLITGCVGLLLAIGLLIFSLVAGPSLQQNMLRWSQQMQQNAQQQQQQQSQPGATTAPSTAP